MLPAPSRAWRTSLVVRFINTLTYFRLCSRCIGGSELIHELSQILTRELPFEGPRGCFPVVLKIKQSFGQAFKVCEIVRVQNLALHYGEVDLDLIEPTGVDGRVNKYQSRIASLQALGGPGPAMR